MKTSALYISAAFAFQLLFPPHGFAQEETCSSISPAEQGWWYVTPMPGYGIKGEIPQFMAGAPVTVWEEANTGIKLASTDESKSKRLTWRFSLNHPSGQYYRSLKATFEKPLGGLEVDAFAQGENGAKIRLLDEKRFFENSVAVTWPDVKVSSVSVTIHAHLQEKPILKEFLVGYTSPMKSIPTVDAGFQKDGVLYFFNPDGRALQVCDKGKFSSEIPLSLLKSKSPKEAKLAPVKK